MKSLRLFCVAIAFLFLSGTLPAAVLHNQAALPLLFEKNQGQLPASAQYLVHQGRIQTVFRENAIEFSFAGSGGSAQHLEMQFPSHGPSSRLEALGESMAISNYLLGADSARWITGIPNYASLQYQSIYPGIDLIFYGDNALLEHDFRLAPFADVSQVAFRIQGAEDVSITSNGDIAIRLARGVLTMNKPVAYQESPEGRQSVAAEFAIDGNRNIGFRLGVYDRNMPLVIDPALSFATFLDTGSDYVMGVTTDSSGATYIVGETFSTSFPVTPGAFQTRCAACSSDWGVAFVTKLNATGTAQVFSTFLGGSNGDTQPNGGIAVDGSGNVVVTGETMATDFPVKNPVSPATTSGGFVVSLTADGSALNYSSLLPIDFLGWGWVTTNAAGDAFVTGTTDSSSFPVTVGAYTSGTPQYPEDIAFVSKFTPSGALAYSALIGDTEPETGGGGFIGARSIAVDAQGSAYLAGAAGTLWPTTSGAYLTQLPGTNNYRGAFITKLSPDGSKLAYSTFLAVGGAVSIAVDAQGRAFVTGVPDQPATFPVTSNAFLPSTQDCCAFMSELSADGSQLLYSTLLGSNPGTLYGGNTYTGSIALDASGDIWISGDSEDPQFPLVHPLEGASGGNEGFIMEFNPTGTQLELSTFFGPPSTVIDGMAIDPLGKVHIAGTAVGSMYTTPGAFVGSVTSASSYSTFPFAAVIDPKTNSSALCGTNSGIYFGYIPVGTIKMQNVTVNNCGTSNLLISTIQSTNSVFTVPAADNHCNVAVAPGVSCTFAVNFAPTDAVIYNATIQLTTNASIPTASFAVNGTGAEPVLTLNAGALSYAPLFVGQSSTLDVWLSNGGMAPLRIDTVATSATGDYSVDASSCSVLLNNGQYCVLIVTFKPTQVGPRSGVLSIVSNASSSPGRVSLSGSGIAFYPVPTITSVNSPTAPVGSSALSVNVYGSGFFPASVIKVNGTAQATSYGGSSYLYFNLDPSLRTSLGELSISVSNPVPGGGASNSAIVTLYRDLAVQPSFAVYSPATKLLYAAVGSSASSNPNTVLPIDPVTGNLGTPIAVGNNPILLALSSDGQTLYVALATDQTVQRINLRTNTVERTFPYPNCNSCYPSNGATEMHVVPGSSQQVVLAANGQMGLYNDSGMVNSITNYAQSFAFVGSTIYSLPFALNSNFFTTIPYTSAGLQQPSPYGYYGEMEPNGATVVSDGTLLYTSAGQLWNPATLTETGQFPVLAYNVESYPNEYNLALDSHLGALFVIGNQNGGDTLSAVAKQSLNLVGTLVFSQLNFGTPMALTRWGADGFAFLSENSSFNGEDLYVVRSPTLASMQPANVSNAVILSAVSPSSVVANGESLAFTISGSNFNNYSVVLWNGFLIPTGYIAATQLVATVPAEYLTQEGTALITVATASASSASIASGAPVAVLSDSPVARISSASVSDTVSGNGTILSLTGSDFVPASIVYRNGASLSTTYISPWQLTAELPASGYSRQPITVANPAGSSPVFILP